MRRRRGITKPHQNESSMSIFDERSRHLPTRFVGDSVNSPDPTPSDVERLLTDVLPYHLNLAG
jgi:hypothetical protein